MRRRLPLRQRSKATLVAAFLLLGLILLQSWRETQVADDRFAHLDGESSHSVVDAGTGHSDAGDQPSAESAVDVAKPRVRAGSNHDEELSDPEDAASRPARDSRIGTPDRKLGELRDIGGRVFQSTAGLYYRPGSQEGHRITHILRHHEDAPDRPVHGVFDGDRNELFAVIDEAYLYSIDHGPPRVTKSMDDGRTILVVDLGRRIGYVGGQSGQRNNYPPASHVQLILDGRNVITAYPVRKSPDHR